jgi:biopolymer transport protein ExbD
MPDVEEKQEQVKPPVSPPERVQFKKKENAAPQIPTASMPDIVFMLLLFFMVTTVFKEFSGLNVLLPSAKQIEKLPGKRNVSYIWIDKDGRISIDDKLVGLKQVAMVMYNKRVENPRIVVSLKIDQGTNMGWVSDVQQQLREADALKINYSAKFGE